MLQYVFDGIYYNVQHTQLYTASHLFIFAQIHVKPVAPLLNSYSDCACRPQMLDSITV